jgi:hypothetical protein
VQFVSNGPDIPDALLQSQEEGRLVFFCGAGISYPADLPSFKGLVEKIYQVIGTAQEDIEREAFERGQFDATLDLLERRLPGQRLAVRRALVQALRPNLRRKGATETQAALLRLARSREGALRLVTTNFDRVFHTAAKRTHQVFQTYAAPMLPIPKNTRWDGLVYLHGLLPETEDDTALNRMVVTSGDFGLAYLTERWAARFVSELFRNYVVCFVGYSINDPVLRYMMDALAADRMLGEVTPQAWALGDCEAGQEHRKCIEWGAKGVKPILYHVATGSNKHLALHQTLQVWADTYRDGTQGKEAIVAKHALTRPQNSTQQDDFVGRMLWALSDETGLPAKRFADFNPAPSLDWLLEPFADPRFGHGDLSRFGVSPRGKVDNTLRFSLIRRPAPYHRAPLMQLAAASFSGSQWDEVMFHLARWLVRHLNDPRLVIWIAQGGGQLLDHWRSLIEGRLIELSAKESEGKIAELDEIRSQAPNAVPSSLMRTLWRLLLSKRVRSIRQDPVLYWWLKRFQQEQWTATLRLELRELLTPKVALTKPFRWSEEEEKSVAEPTRLRQLVGWRLELSEDNVYTTLQDAAGARWASVLPDLLEDFQHLLRDALDLSRELGEANDHSDRSYYDLPSITPHRQNRGFRGWVSLIELLRDAWLAAANNGDPRATRVVHSWFELPYPTFKRLALFAASKEDSIPVEHWVDWLLDDASRWLWSTETRREVIRLFVLQGRHLRGTGQERLEVAILAGPPREMYRDDLEPGEWTDLVARSVWLRLAKLHVSGLTLGASAAAHLAQLSTEHPQWQLQANESDEFSFWMSGTGDPDYDDRRMVNAAPRNWRDLVGWLASSPSDRGPFREDTWVNVCRTRFFHSLRALCVLAQRSEWPASRWREALQTWAEEGLVVRSWHYAAPLVQRMPDAILQEIIHAVAWWIEAASKSISRHEQILLDLCRRMLALNLDAGNATPHNDDSLGQPVTQAINHPVGLVTQAVINLWFKRNPNDNDRLPDEIKSFFTQICNFQEHRFRHGRVLLGSRLIALFRVDRAWTECHLLPLFDWGRSIEAKYVWNGFLWSPRLYQPLLTAFKQQLLATAGHYAELGEHREQFAAFLTYAALGGIEGYSVGDFRSAIGALPQEGLEQSAQALVQALEAAAGQREDFWRNRAHPFWQQIWPKSLELVSPLVATFLARLAIAARGEFPAALGAVQHWLKPIDHPDFTVHLLCESRLCKRFPAETLSLLNAVIAEPPWVPQELSQCLDAIVDVAPDLAQNACYLRLREYLRRHTV